MKLNDKAKEIAKQISQDAYEAMMAELEADGFGETEHLLNSLGVDTEDAYTVPTGCDFESEYDELTAKTIWQLYVYLTEEMSTMISNRLRDHARSAAFEGSDSLWENRPF